MSKPTIRQWLKDNKANYDNTVEGRKKWIKDCCNILGHSYKTVTGKACQVWPFREAKSCFQSNEDSTADIISPNDFIQEIDIVGQVEDFLNNIVKDGYIECEKLRRKFDVPPTKWRELKRLQKFDDRQFTYTKASNKKTTVWSSIKGIQLAKETINMSRYDI